MPRSDAEKLYIPVVTGCHSVELWLLQGLTAPSSVWAGAAHIPSSLRREWRAHKGQQGEALCHTSPR